MPPPSTRSSSATPVTSRASASSGTAESGTGSAPGASATRRGTRARTGVGTVSSTIVFHPPQSGQRPIQRGAS